MPSISKSHGVWRVRIRRLGLPMISKVFKSKTDAHTWAFKTERSMELGFLSPDHDCLLKTLLERYRREIAVWELEQILIKHLGIGTILYRIPQ